MYGLYWILRRGVLKRVKFIHLLLNRINKNHTLCYRFWHIIMSAFNSIITCYRHIIHCFAQGRISYRFTTLNQIPWRRLKIKENDTIKDLFVSVYNHETFSMYRDQNKKILICFIYIHIQIYIHWQVTNYICLPNV